MPFRQPARWSMSDHSELARILSKFLPYFNVKIVNSTGLLSVNVKLCKGDKDMALI